MSELAAHVRPAAGEPEGALVLMHGRATSEQDLAPLLDVFDPEGPTVEGYELDLSDRSGFPVAIGHGTLDQIIPVEFGRQAAQRLREAGADVLYRESPVPHTIDPREIPTFVEWLQRTMERARTA